MHGDTGLNGTPGGERIHIAILGRMNAGKSSLINAITGQELAIVSDVEGTTTDPVYKAMEILPLGPVMCIDTPGLDDTGRLGQQRAEKTMQVIRKSHMALVVMDAGVVEQECRSGREDALAFEKRIVKSLRENKTPYVLVCNKTDLVTHREDIKKWVSCLEDGDDSTTVVETSAETGEGIEALKDAMVSLMPEEGQKSCIIRDKLNAEDVVVLVVPIDSAAPKGRLILPQQQTIRDILDAGAVCMVTRETELPMTLKALGKTPKVVITDSQVFERVSKDTPEDIFLTSFSILFARHKGNLRLLVEGVKRLDALKDGDRVLIAEGCTHRRQCEDIGTVKIPRWIREYTGKDIQFETCSGTEFPGDVRGYAMVVHCGGCMLNPKEMGYRMELAKEQGVPMVNYGVLIAYLHGVLERSLELFPEIHALLDESGK